MATEVCLRHVDAATGAKLGEIDLHPNSIELLMSTIKAWGVIADGNYADIESIVGQFVVEPERAYFEIVVGDE